MWPWYEREVRPTGPAVCFCPVLWERWGDGTITLSSVVEWMGFESGARSWRAGTKSGVGGGREEGGGNWAGQEGRGERQWSAAGSQCSKGDLLSLSLWHPLSGKQQHAGARDGRTARERGQGGREGSSFTLLTGRPSEAYGILALRTASLSSRRGIL